MPVAFFDTISGISGDMVLGAAVSLGVDLDQLSSMLATMPIGRFQLTQRSVRRNSIAAVRIDVKCGEDEHHHRTISEINSIIDAGSFSESVKLRAKQIFQIIADAESAVHGVSIEQVHFHEVGAVDSILDIVGIAAAFEKLGIERAYSSPVRVGRGFADTQHGKIPIPAPGTLQILRGYPIEFVDVPFELTTPTGAAILRAYSEGLYDEKEAVIEQIGYGAGTMEIPGIPNLFRLMVGSIVPRIEREEIFMVETNIDDMNPELYPFIIERLMETGAYDAFLVPIIMKKGRPGILLSAMVDRNNLDNIVQTIYKETSTLGVRIYPIDRRKLPRIMREVKTTFGIVRVKEVEIEGRQRLLPEYEECRRIARERSMPLFAVYKELEAELYAMIGLKIS
ncbi:MAG: nickel pincer cofactor biosynthesis protein LarC [Bacteroidota bacterium]